jgi:hypothetical protein
LDLEDDLWEKFYKKKDFKLLGNTLTLSENMLKILTNPNIKEFIVQSDIKELNDIAISIANADVKDLIPDVSVVDEMFTSFTKMYK